MFSPVKKLLMNNRPNIVLLNPPRRDQCKDFPYNFVRENLSLACLASYLRRHSTVKVIIIDSFLEDLSINETVRRTAACQPVLIGISVTFLPAEELLKTFLQRLRRAGINCRIVIGGNHATFESERILRNNPQVEAVVCGDGESTLLEIVRRTMAGKGIEDISGIAYRKKGMVQTIPLKPPEKKLDNFPYPARDTLPLVISKNGMASVSASRGCYARCKFCSIRAFYGMTPGPRWRGRSPENIAGEFKSLRIKFGVQRVAIVDDNFSCPGRAGHRRSLEIAKALKATGNRIVFFLKIRASDLDETSFSELKEAGLRAIFLGLESGHQLSLDIYQKDCTTEQNLKAVSIIRKLGLAGIYGMIMFNPHSTWNEFDANLKMMRDIGDFNLGVVAESLTELPGAEFEKEYFAYPKHPGVRGFPVYKIHDPSIRYFAKVLSRCVAEILPVCALWEQIKFDIWMNWTPDEDLVSRFRELNASFQQGGLNLIGTMSQEIRTCKIFHRGNFLRRHRLLFEKFNDKWTAPLLELDALSGRSSRCRDTISGDRTARVRENTPHSRTSGGA